MVGVTMTPVINAPAHGQVQLNVQPARHMDSDTAALGSLGSGRDVYRASTLFDALSFPMALLGGRVLSASTAINIGIGNSFSNLLCRSMSMPTLSRQTCGPVQQRL